MIEFILGKCGSGKSHRVLQEMSHAYDKNRTDHLILIIPEQYSLEASADFMDKMGNEGHIHLDVLSFKRLAHRVFEQTGMTDRVQINDLGKTMLLRHIFSKHAESLKVYGKMAGRNGFMESFNGLIGELKRAQISEESLRRQIEGMEDSLIRRKLEDIVLLYSAFEGQMQLSYFDDEDVLNLLIEKMDEAHFLKGAKVWIDGFNGFTQQEYAVLRKLMAHVPEVTFAFTYAEDALGQPLDVFESTAKTLRTLEHAAEALEVKTNRSFMKERAEVGARAKVIEAVSRALFTYPLETFERTGGCIELAACQSRHIEIERVGRGIVQLAREKGYEWRDIAVVTPQIGDYAMHVKRIFTAMNIPFFLDEKRSVMNHPLVQYLMGILKFFAYGYRYEDAFRILKSGLTLLDDGKVQVLENYVLGYGIKHGAWWKPFYKGPEDVVAEAEAIRLEWIETLEGFRKGLKKSKTVEGLAKNLFEHIEGVKLHERLTVHTEMLFERGLLDQANESAQVWNATLEILDQLVELIGGDETDIKAFVKLMETGFASTEVGIIPPAKDRVLIGSMERSRSHDIKALFVVGVNDGNLPMTGDNGGILSDADKVLLKASGLALKSDYETLSLEEQLSVYQALCKPSERLYISYAMSDADGKALRPSVYFERLKSILRGAKVQMELAISDKEPMRYVATPESTMQALIEHKRNMLDGGKTDVFWDTLEKWYKQDETYGPRYRSIESGYFHKNQVASIGKSLAGKLYGAPLRSSVSRFEKYVQCPFAHFVSYGLKPEERKLYQIELPDLGTIYHESVERFSHMLDKEKLDWRTLDKGDSDRIIEGIIDEVAQTYGHDIFKASSRYAYLIKRIKRVGRRAAWTMTRQIKSGSFMPSAYELAFRENGGAESVPPILLELPGGDTILLEGRIDRIDVFEDGKTKSVKIVDYKSGSRRFHLSDVFYGLQIQLVVYLDAVIQNAHYLKMDGLVPGGIFYFKIDDPMVESDAYDPESIETQISQALKMDGLVVKDINVMRAMDAELAPGTKSDVIPAEIKQDGTVSSRSSAIEADDFKLLMDHVRKLMTEIGQEIVGGKIKIDPCKYSGMTSCDYCPYRGICQFDQLFENNRYRYMKKKKNDEVLEALRENAGESGKVDEDAKVDS